VLRFYAADEVHAALEYPRLADALARAFAAGAQVPVRHAHRLGDGDSLLLMPAWSSTALGVKLVTVMPGNGRRGVGTVQAIYVLLDRTTGEPLALLDGEALTLRRTAATSALAARYLARDDAENLLVVGAGRLAPYLACAHCALRPALRRVSVWARDPSRAQAAVQWLRGRGVAAEAAANLERAVREAQIVSCATTATAPVVLGDWLAPGTHLDLVGAFTPQMREVDDAAVARSRVFVDTRAGALAEAGDLLLPMASGVITREAVIAEMAELVRGEKAGREGADDVTLFKSVGTALEDLAAAALVVARA
jgi:ornithine cyclodeaminase/alanine dehydrogenase-like protein (mu-crystallin family)